MMTTIKQLLYNQFENTFLKMGFIKADQIPRLAQMLFAGEGVRYQEDYKAQTDIEIQRLAVTNPWVYSNIMLIAERVALGRLMTEVQNKEGIWTEDLTHEFTELFEENPNPYMGQMYIWMYQVFWLLLRGEAYWMQVPNKTGDGLAEVYPLPASRIEPIPDDEKLFAGFEYTPAATGTPEYIAPEHIVFHRLPNPFNYNRGLSPLTAYVLGLQIDREAQKFDLQDYKQGLTLKHIISLRPEISDVDMIRYQREIDEATASGRRFMVTRGGDIKTAPISVRRGSETQSENVRTLTKKEADYIYNVPEGLREASATRANATVAETSLVSNAIWPIMSILGEDLTVQSVRRWYGSGIRAAFEDPRIPDREMEMKADNHRRQYQTFDEVRVENGLDPYYNESIGREKFSSADELIKISFEAEIENAKIKQETITVQETKDGTQEEEEQEQAGEGNDESPVKSTEFDHWFNAGWLLVPTTNGKVTLDQENSPGTKQTNDLLDETS